MNQQSSLMRIASPSSSLARLDKLPTEIMTIIARYLDLDTIKSVRLCSSSLWKRSFDDFRYYIRQKKIELIPAHLESIVQDLQHGGLACYMEEIVFIHRDPWKPYGEAISEPWSALQSLCTVLSLAKVQGRLKAIDVELREPSFNILLCALSITQIELQRLRFYPHRDPPLAARHTYRITDCPDLSLCLRSVQDFSWSIRSNAQRPSAVNKILSMLRGVKTLNLEWSNISTPRAPEMHFFKVSLPSILAMRKLHQCTLKGIHLSESTLLEFLHHTTATVIILQHVYLLDGTWRSIIDILTSSKFKHITLDKLHTYQDGDLATVYFSTDDTSGIDPCRRSNSSSSSLEQLSSFITRSNNEACQRFLSYTCDLDE